MRPGATAYQRRTPGEMAEIRWIVHHHTHAGPGRPSAENIAAYQTGSTAHLPFPAIAYAVFVEADGTAKLCHDLDEVTWGQGDGSPTVKRGVGSNNWLGIAVCFSGQEPTPAQLVALRRVGDEIDRVLGRRLERVGHQDVSLGADGRPLTECPGETWEGWRDRIA